MSKTIKAGIIGGAGYTGGEMIRLLLNHPQVMIAGIHSRSQAGQPVHVAHPDLVGETDLQFSETIPENVDVLFLCVGHGEAKKFLEQNKISSDTRIIDLSQDFRLKANSSFGERKFVYGLPEINRDAIKEARNIANPGCFATAIQLGLLPLASKDMVDQVYTTGITGSTGAGQGLSATSHFSWRAGNIQAYKTLSHQHLGEIGQSLEQTGATASDIFFVPWRGDFTRGIFASSTIHCEKPLAWLTDLYQEFYHEHPFVYVSAGDIFLKQVINTNKAVIKLEKVGAKLVVHSAIDNLLKGASGQAVQNMNLMFGVEETAGLKLKPSAF